MATTEENPRFVVICDAGPLIHLDELGCLDLLADFGSVWVPNVVWEEVNRHRADVFRDTQVNFMRVFPKQAEPPELQALVQALTLHPGEREAIHVALEDGRRLLLADDAAARMAAVSLGLPVHGSIGVIVRAIRRRLRTKQEVVNILRSLPKRSSLHLKQSLLDSVIAEVENS